MKELSCNKREDPVACMVRDMTAEEMVAWMVEYHGLNAGSARTVIINLAEQYRWHRLQGRLDRNTTAGLIAELMVMRRSPLLLVTPRKDEA